jgi:hypothetical protein
MTLYELTQQYLEVLNFINDPEIEQQYVIDTLESLESPIEEKMINVGKFIASIEAEAEAIAEVEKRQHQRRRTLENKAIWLRSYLQESMLKTEHTKIEAPEIEIKLAKLPVSVQILDESLIPPAFWKETVTRAIDKLKIKDVGGCPGTLIESKGYRVSIK